MATSNTLTKDDLEPGKEGPYHHLVCKQMSELRITLTEAGQQQRRAFSILGLSSKESISTGLKAVDASPFKTVFVVDEKSGTVLFALSKNTEFVKASRKKDPPPPPPPPTDSFCCTVCYHTGGYQCDDLSDGSCICYGASRGGTPKSVDDDLGTLAP